MVYGLATDVDKPDFLMELYDLRQVRMGPWLLCCDFNMIYLAEDKNNSRLNKRLMGQLRRLLNDAVLKEIHLQGRLFTWSNDRVHPTLEHIDHAFTSNEWRSFSLTMIFTLCHRYALTMHH
jgi:hypothetical protein